MVENSSFSAKSIIAKIKKTPKIAALLIIFAIILAIATTFGVIVYLNKESYGAPIAVICGFLSIVFFVIGIIKLLSSKSKLKGINLDRVEEEVKTDIISFFKEKTFFTTNHILSNYHKPFIIKYLDIIWMYRVDKFNKSGSVIGSDLIIHLVNGRKLNTVYSSDFVDIIKRHNSNIFDSYSIENKKMYKEIVNNYKKFKQNEVVVKPEVETTPPPEEVSTEVPDITPTIKEPTQMIEIDPLYNIPGMVYNSNETKATTNDFLMMNEKVVENTVVPPVVPSTTPPQINNQQMPPQPQNINNESYDVNQIKNPFINN